MEPFGAFFGAKCTPYLEVRIKVHSGVKGLNTNVHQIFTGFYCEKEPKQVISRVDCMFSYSSVWSNKCALEKIQECTSLFTVKLL